MVTSLLFDPRYDPLRRICNAVAALFAVLVITIAPLQAQTRSIVALGDSLTAGYGLPEGDGLVPQMQAWLTAQGADVTLVNAGVSGDTTAGGLARLDWALSPDTGGLMVLLGGNDMLRGIDPASTRANLDAILKTATQRGIPVLLVSLRAPGNYGESYKSAFDAIYPDLAATYGAVLADNYFIPLIDQQNRLLDPALMQADGIHPNKAGVARIVPVLGPKLLELIARMKG